jgi:hypothetical protein
MARHSKKSLLIERANLPERPVDGCAGPVIQRDVFRQRPGDMLLVQRSDDPIAWFKSRDGGACCEDDTSAVGAGDYGLLYGPGVLALGY